MSLTNLEVEFYVLTHRGNPGDRAFYARSCNKTRRVLELGTGYGRLIPDLLGVSKGGSSRRELWGLDQDSRMLAAARQMVQQLSEPCQRRVKLTTGDMRDFELDVLFDRIVLPYNGLYCLLNRRDMLRCFKCVKRHLAPGGQFIFDVWAADRFHEDASSSAHYDERDPILTIAHRSQTWDVFETSRLRSRLQRLDVTYTYVSRESGTSVTIPISQRYATSMELRELLGSAGFQLDSAAGGFSGQRFRKNSEFLVMRAT